jgi:hypothetical protein
VYGTNDGERGAHAGRREVPASPDLGGQRRRRRVVGGRELNKEGTSRRWPQRLASIGLASERTCKGKRDTGHGGAANKAGVWTAGLNDIVQRVRRAEALGDAPTPHLYDTSIQEGTAVALRMLIRVSTHMDPG